MPNAEDMQWFKENFHAPIEAAIAGTPFTLDLLVAIACQETGHIWSVLRKKPLTLDEILALCVGDTLDAPNRSAFPKTKAALLAQPRGDEMFRIARKALEDMAKHISGFPVSNPNKFCHGYGMFQYDLQFFLEDPAYFLEKRYEKFGETLAKSVKELTAKAKKIRLFDKPSLEDMELTAVAIAYNTGTFKPALGLKQGHFNGSRFYGEEIFDFIRMSRTVPVPGGAPDLVKPSAGNAAVPPPTPVAEATGPFFEVDTQLTSLRVRSEPKISSPPTANVIAQLPDGHPVRAVTGNPVGKFLEIETSLNGAHIRGFASTMFLKPAPAVTEVPVVMPDPTPPASGIVAVFMPRKSASVTKRTTIAGAHSLNEPDMPERKGTTPAELCTDLAAIITYLASDKAAHKRYQPRSGLTFCNIYTHDYCHLAGVYLPRVWWTPGAIEQLAQGKEVEPLIGNTIDEQRANDLFRWLRDFGPRFGWRQTGTATKLQQEANQGAIGLIVARRKEDGKSGHIVAVVPETETDRAKRNAAGEVTHPLQSQAGRVNFRYGTSTLDWWKSDQFGESAFWLHA
jgi:hypothetical protein